MLRGDTRTPCGSSKRHLSLTTDTNRSLGMRDFWEWYISIMLGVLIGLVLTSCSTAPKARPGLPTPPVRAVKAKAERPPYIPRTTWTLRWGNCQAQPEGVWFEIHWRATVSASMTLQDTNWILFGRYTNTYEAVIPLTNDAAFFLLSSVKGNERSWAVRDCMVIAGSQ